VVLITGIAVIDVIGSGFARVAEPGELVYGSVRYSLGGHACNVSVDLAQLGFPKSQLRAVFPAGRDIFGGYLVDTLKKRGVVSEPVLLPGIPTSLDLILVAKGQDRRFHVDPGANVAMPADAVMALIKKYRPRLFYAGGTGLMKAMDARLDDVLKLARSLGALTFVDIVSPYRQTWAFLRRALPQIDIFHCNTDEAAEITGVSQPRPALDKLRGLGPKFVFLTSGAQGGLAGLPGATLHLPAFSITAKDPTGAGDAFSAALILKIYRSLRRGIGPADIPVKDWKAILLYASACGAVCCTGLGATTSVTEEKVESLVRRQGRAFSRAVMTLG